MKTWKLMMMVCFASVLMMMFDTPHFAMHLALALFSGSFAAVHLGLKI